MEQCLLSQSGGDDGGGTYLPHVDGRAPQECWVLVQGSRVLAQSTLVAACDLESSSLCRAHVPMLEMLVEVPAEEKERAHSP